MIVVRPMRKNKGFSLIELLIVVAIILLIAAIAVPNLLRARMSANESAAASTIRNLNNSQATYLINFGTVGYADTPAKLGPGSPCNELHACLVDELIGCATQPCNKSGYQYYLVAGAGPPFGSYTFTATPVGWNATGRRNICAVEDGVIRQQVGAAAKLTAGAAHGDCSDATKYSALGD